MLRRLASTVISRCFQRNEIIAMNRSARQIGSTSSTTYVIFLLFTLRTYLQTSPLI